MKVAPCWTSNLLTASQSAQFGTEYTNSSLGVALTVMRLSVQERSGVHSGFLECLSTGAISRRWR
jgi:hypothetical protein